MITPNKDRYLSPYQKIEVYRNLNKEGVTYSIRQGGRVVAHATELSLRDVEFHVQPAGQKRVRKTKRKNVHAWVTGFLTDYAKARVGKKMTRIVYDPYRFKHFVNAKTKRPVHKAKTAVLYSQGVIAYLPKDAVRRG